MVNFVIANAETILFTFCAIISSDSTHADHVMTRLSPPDGSIYDFFGGAVSVYGETAIIGAYGDMSSRGSAYIFDAQSNGNWTLSQKILSSDGSIPDRFGCSVSLYEETAIIGAYQNTPNGVSRSGAAYIFKKQINGTWIEMQKLTGSDRASRDYFGFAVSIYEDTAIIGAYLDDENGVSNSGAVYIFQQHSDGQWVEVQKLRASDASSSAFFGNAVDIYNDTIIVGARGRNQAYIFEKSNNGTWIETSILSAASGWFGLAVSVYGNNLIVGAWYDSTLGNVAGAAYIYSKTDGDMWQLQQTLFANDTMRGDLFGVSVSIYNQTVVIGAYQDDDMGLASGSAYTFNKVSDGQWIETAKITAFDGGKDRRFGAAASIHGENILIGTQLYTDDGTKIDSGTAYALKNWKSCNQIWIESDDYQQLINTTNRYLVNWRWTSCNFLNFTASPTPQPTEFPSYLPSQQPTADPTAIPTSLIPSTSPTNIFTTTTPMAETDETSETDGDSKLSVILTAILCAISIYYQD